MKLKINGFENEIQFDNESVNVLEIKSPKCFSHIINVLNDKINGIESNEVFLIDDDSNELNMNKNILMIFDLFNIDYNSKKILGKLYDIIEDNINKNQDLEIENMMTKVRNYLIQEINELPFEFVMKTDLDIPEVLKLFGLKLDVDNYETILEKVEFLINLLSTLEIAKILVVPNLKQYLTENELVELYKYSLYNNIELVLIERDNNFKLKYEKVLCIDENFTDYIV